MYPLALIIGTATLLIALLGAALAIVMPRAARSHKPVSPDLAPESRFAVEFIGELTRLNDEPVRASEVSGEPFHTELPKASHRGMEQKDAYALHKQGEPLFRIATRLGISKADAELLIRVEDTLNRNKTVPEEG